MLQRCIYCTADDLKPGSIPLLFASELGCHSSTNRLHLSLWCSNEPRSRRMMNQLLYEQVSLEIIQSNWAETPRPEQAETTMKLLLTRVLLLTVYEHAMKTLWQGSAIMKAHNTSVLCQIRSLSFSIYLSPFWRKLTSHRSYHRRWRDHEGCKQSFSIFTYKQWQDAGCKPVRWRLAYRSEWR